VIVAVAGVLLFVVVLLAAGLDLPAPVDSSRVLHDVVLYQHPRLLKPIFLSWSSSKCAANLVYETVRRSGSIKQLYH
jgi:hypothetical protein